MKTRIEMLENAIETLEKELELLMFQVELLYENSALDRFVFESRLTKTQLNAIMSLLDKFRKELDMGHCVNSNEFEMAIYDIIPEKKGQYHFCETIARLFAEDGRWEEVFPALYGGLPKYQNWNIQMRE